MISIYNKDISGVFWGVGFSLAFNGLIKWSIISEFKRQRQGWEEEKSWDCQTAQGKGHGPDVWDAAELHWWEQRPLPTDSSRGSL